MLLTETISSDHPEEVDLQEVYPLPLLHQQLGFSNLSPVYNFISFSFAKRKLKKELLIGKLMPVH